MQPSVPGVQRIPFIRRACPELSEQELETAEVAFMRYVEIATSLLPNLDDSAI